MVQRHPAQDPGASVLTGVDVTAGRAGADIVGQSTDDPTWERLEDQLAWYDRKSTTARRAYTHLKVVELVVAAAVPVAAGLGAYAVVTASLGAVVVILEGVQHLYQWHDNYVRYRSTAEALKQEKSLYTAHAGPYRRGPDRHRLLAERLEQVLGHEHTRWTETSENDTPEATSTST